jgi:molybdopterin/thiamine biosynthesis adenylyltransferase
MNARIALAAVIICAVAASPAAATVLSASSHAVGTKPSKADYLRVTEVQKELDATLADVNDAAVAAGVPLVHAGVLGFRGQIMTVLPGASACYRCVFEDAPPPGEVPSCEEAGILGPTAALAGALAAAEAVRIVTGTGASYADRLLVIDTFGGGHRSVPIGRRPHCRTCGSAPRNALGSMAS